MEFKMKKIFALAIAAIMLLTLVTSCKKEAPTADEVYAAIEKTATLDSYHMSYDIAMHMTQGNESMDAPVKGSTKKAVIDGENVMEYKMSVDFGESVSETVMYVTKGTAYMELMGNKMKLPVENAASSVPMLDLSQLKKGDITSVSEVDGDSADKVYKVEFEEDSLNTLFDLLLGTDSSDGTSYKNVDVNFTVNEDGYMSVCRLSFEVVAADDELGEYGTVADCTFTYDSPGSAVEITLPDLSGYADATIIE